MIYDDYYQILGVKKNASKEEIRRAFRRLSLENHPDRNKNDNIKGELFKKVTQAYNILSDESERNNFDNLSNIGNLFNNFGEKLSKFSNPDNSMDMNANVYAMNLDPKMVMDLFMNKGISNLFNQEKTHFPGFQKHEYSSKPASINKELDITINDAYIGCKQAINIARWIIEEDTKVRESETIYIDIPKGIDDNEIIVLENRGNVINNDNRGDIKVKIKIENSSNFTRNGLDLIYKKTISLKESLCGFTFDLKYIDGREFKINNEAGKIIPDGFKKTIEKMGMRRDNDIGNLIIHFSIDYPKELSKENLKKLEKLL